MKAWLISWQGTNCPERVASILSPHWGAKKVAEHVERIHADTCYSRSERLDAIKNPKAEAYPAKIERGGRISCGHNPHLCGRKVKDLSVTDADGEERFHWREIPSNRKASAP